MGLAVVGEEYCGEGERELTVQKTSLFFPGDGFTAYDHQSGDLVFRVDTYAQRSLALAGQQQLVLMDPHGAPILTLRRKWPSLHQRWEGFLGERNEGQKPLFTVRRSSIFGGDRGSLAVEVHPGVGPATAEADYRIEGAFAQRCCRMLYEGVEGAMVVAEIQRKVDACANVVMGKDVFSLTLTPRFDAAFVMGLVLVVDQITGDDEDDDQDTSASASASASLDPLEDHNDLDSHLNAYG